MVITRVLRAHAFLLDQRVDDARSEVLAALPEALIRTPTLFIPRLGTLVLLSSDDTDIRAVYEILCRAGGRFTDLAESADYIRGALAMRLGLLDEAAEHFQTGRDSCERERCPIEAGRCHQGLADVAERRGEIEGAREHLDAAGALFAQHGAKLYLDQVLAKKQFLKA